MMKSFFKKLAFVMALAMVVTTAAPAANVFAAAFGIVAQDDATWTVVETANVEVDGKADFKFVGAPSNWKELGFVWTSSDEDVATVNQAGVVTGVADGVATITLADKAATYVATLEVTVGKGVVEETTTFVAEQISDKVAELTFTNTEITKAEIEAGLEFYYYIGDVKVTYPVEVTKVKDGIATITSYVFFTDGVTYGFTFGEEKDEFVASVGKVVALDASWSCRKVPYVAYIGEDSLITPVLRDANGKDVTESAKTNGGTFTFELVNNAPNGEFWVSDPINGKVYFTSQGLAQVKVTYTEYSRDTYEKTLELTKVLNIPSQAAPIYTVDMTKAQTATIANAGQNPAYYNWSYATTTIALGDDVNHNQKLFVKMKDNLGYDVYTTAANDPRASFRFKSTNESVLYVTADGTLAANTVGTVSVLVYLDVYLDGATYPVTKVVGVVPVTVAPKRAVTNLSLNKTTDAISTAGAGYGFNETSFKLTLKDQLGSKMNANTANGVPVITVTCNNTNLPAGVYAPNTAVRHDDTGVYYIDVVSVGTSNLPANSTAYTYTYTVKVNNALTRTFSVTVRQPGASVTGYKLEFSSTDDIKTQKYTNGQPDITKTVTPLKNTLSFYELSNGVKLDKVNLEYKPTDRSTWQVGTYYYSVAKDGKDLVLPSVAGIIDLTTFKAAPEAASGTALAGQLYVDKTENGVGTYTVIVYKGVGVYGASVGSTASALTQIASNTLTVEDSQDAMAFLGKLNNSAAQADIATIVMNNFKFKIGYTEMDTTAEFTAQNIVPIVNANFVSTTTDSRVPQAGTTAYIRSVDFYKLVGKSGSQNVYVKYTIPVNQSIEITAPVQ